MADLVLISSGACLLVTIKLKDQRCQGHLRLLCPSFFSFYSSFSFCFLPFCCYFFLFSLLFFFFYFSACRRMKEKGGWIHAGGVTMMKREDTVAGGDRGSCSEMVLTTLAVGCCGMRRGGDGLPSARDGCNELGLCSARESRSLLELVDPRLGLEFNQEEAIGMINIALLCTSTSSPLRPTMSSVASMLEGHTVVQSHISKPNISTNYWSNKSTRSRHQRVHSQEQSQSICIDGPQTASFDLYPIIMDSDFRNHGE